MAADNRAVANKSKIVKNEQRRAVVARYAARRAGLKRVIVSPASSPGERDDCACQHRMPPGPGQADGLHDAQAYQQIARWNTAVLTRAGMSAGTGPAAQEGGPVL
ncbi:MAG TPA: hypothetical protein VE733_23990 [Streptosporangiaceae bacterium]|nr:hypothetical protein [Streptosporangiaceae bacterium]